MNCLTISDQTAFSTLRDWVSGPLPREHNCTACLAHRLCFDPSKWFPLSAHIESLTGWAKPKLQQSVIHRLSRTALPCVYEILLSCCSDVPQEANLIAAATVPLTCTSHVYLSWISCIPSPTLYIFIASWQMNVILTVCDVYVYGMKSYLLINTYLHEGNNIYIFSVLSLLSPLC